MLIGVDLDEVLAETIQPLLMYHNNKYDTNLSRDQMYSYNFLEVWGGTREESIEKMYDFYASPYFKSIRPIDGSQEGVRRLKEKHELIVVTARPEDIADETMNWLSEYFQDRFSDVYFTNEWVLAGSTWSTSSKLDICLRLGVDVLVDDSLANSIQCASSGLTTLLLDCPWNQTDDLPLPLGVTRVYSWQEILEKI